MDDENICSVCWDTFKFPKLLPCKHTFCLPCLHEFLEGLKDKSNLVCPLCREPCYVPEKGFSDFPTNYFVPVEEIAKHCQECKKSFVSKVCFTCNTFLCMKCDVTHSHIKKTPEGEEEDSEIGSDASLPFHLRMLMKTEFLYKEISMFMAEFPSTVNGRKNILSMTFSRNGGIYVTIPHYNTLLKYNKKGNVTDRIHLVAESATVLETSYDMLLITHHSLHTTVFYTNDIPGFKYAPFAKTPKFHPIGLSELRNRNIVIGGPTHLCGSKCKYMYDDCEFAKNSPGLLHVFSPEGDFRYEISAILIFPTHIASSSKADTIAVCDTHLKNVIILNYQGKVQSLYKGWGRLHLALFPEAETFIPTSVCSTSDGNYVIADACHNCLHVLSPYGKFIGILRCENGDAISNTSALCVDSEDNIWAGHHIQGTISVLRPSRFINVFNQFQLPLLPEIPQMSGDLGE